MAVSLHTCISRVLKHPMSYTRYMRIAGTTKQQPFTLYVTVRRNIDEHGAFLKVLWEKYKMRVISIFFFPSNVFSQFADKYTGLVKYNLSVAKALNYGNF